MGAGRLTAYEPPLVLRYRCDEVCEGIAPFPLVSAIVKTNPVRKPSSIYTVK